MNVLAISGRITKDLELKGNSENPFLAFSIGHNIGYGDKKEVNFFDCKVFGKTAEFLNKYAGKGDEVYLVGRLQVDSWEKDGEKKSRVTIYVNQAEIGRKKGGDTKEAVTADAVASAFGAPGLDAEIPF